ncbi:hypothetical protein BDP27DRAFT_1419954 [Rhodocollybia butyracea]|uniref:Uncharacterized protein n=1 Tax=Rhodocollybia butyracea TaxID=206335 RepID=A0A9P5PYH7_9AGAR|nr:hypothetical protein BDP27DRAFT_1419954 [Rhodocollybia butyracea]
MTFLSLAQPAAMHWFMLVSIHLMARLYIATQDRYKYTVSAQELELYQSWVQPEFAVFIDASEFYLPAIEAAVDLRDFKTTWDRAEHVKCIQTLREEIGKYRTFYNNAVESRSFDASSSLTLIALKLTIIDTRDRGVSSATRVLSVRIFICLLLADHTQLVLLLKAANTMEEEGDEG